VPIFVLEKTSPSWHLMQRRSAADICKSQPRDLFVTDDRGKKNSEAVNLCLAYFGSAFQPRRC